MFRPALIVATSITALALSACTSPTSSSTPDSTAGASVAAADYPSGHIHGMSVDPGTNRILLATHEIVCFARNPHHSHMRMMLTIQPLSR